MERENRCRSSMRWRAAEWEGEHMGGMEDGRWSSISIKGTEMISSILYLKTLQDKLQ